MLRCSGIYEIRNTFTGDCYIGSAWGVWQRRNSHLHALRRQKHDSVYLQRAWDKYGSSAFKFKVLIRCRIEDLLFFEQRAIDVFKPVYNMCKTAGNAAGTTKSPAARDKMRAAKLGKKYTAEHRAAISAGSKGKPKKPFSAAHRAKMRTSRLRYLYG